MSADENPWITSFQSRIDELESGSSIPRLEAKVAALTEINTHLMYQTRTDARTGIWNQRAYDEALPFAEAMPGIHIVVIDVDRFKAVNDNLGYRIGDYTVQLVATALEYASLVVCGSKTVARIGGDEFAAFVPADDDVVEEFCLVVLEFFYAQLVGNRLVHLSFGVGQTVKEAEQELRRDKQRGRTLERAINRWQTNLPSH